MTTKTAGSDTAPFAHHLQVTASFFQRHAFFILSTVALSAAIVYTNFSRRDGVSYMDDLTNGTPKRGELGLGRFEIAGTTVPFEYPFRLAVTTIPSAVTPWICYLLHQFGQFYIIYKAKKAKAVGLLEWTTASEWNPYATAMLKLNVGMIMLHYLQTQLFYDGLASTFPEISTLFAGVSSILVAFVFKVQRRGLIFGWTPEYGRELLYEFTTAMREYHGYFASFGIVLTFWHHCMESTYAHLTGFIHIFLLFWQSSLLYQNQHRNQYWALLLEMWILVHGSVVAYYQGYIDGALYLMFFTSFTLLFLMGPLYGIPFVKEWLENGNKNARRQALLYGSLAWFVYFAISQFSAYNALHYSFLVIALPVLYYAFGAWYFAFYCSGKWMDSILVSRGWITRASTVWWCLVTFWGFMSLASIMFLSEFIYRIFVPVGGGKRWGC